MNSIRFFVAAVVFSFLAACANTGMVTPQTTRQRIAVAQASVTEVRKQTTMLLNAGKIKVEDAENIQNMANGARTAIDLSRALLDSDPSAADAKLATATVLLTSLQQYLITQGASK